MSSILQVNTILWDILKPMKEKFEFHIGVRPLSNTENGLRYASGPVLNVQPSVTYISITENSGKQPFTSQNVKHARS